MLRVIMNAIRSVFLGFLLLLPLPQWLKVRNIDIDGEVVHNLCRQCLKDPENECIILIYIANLLPFHIFLSQSLANIFLIQRFEQKLEFSFEALEHSCVDNVRTSHGDCDVFTVLLVLLPQT